MHKRAFHSQLYNAVEAALVFTIQNKVHWEPEETVRMVVSEAEREGKNITCSSGLKGSLTSPQRPSREYKGVSTSRL